MAREAKFIQFNLFVPKTFVTGNNLEEFSTFMANICRINNFFWQNFIFSGFFFGIFVIKIWHKNHNRGTLLFSVPERFHSGTVRGEKHLKYWNKKAVKY